MPALRSLALILAGLFLCSNAFAQSLRYFGNGVNDIDRVKVRIDPQVPADIGATDFTIDFWMKTASGNNAQLWRCDVAEQQWNYGNILVDRSRYGQTNSFGASLLSGRVAFGVRTSQGEWTTCSPATPRVDDGNWHHIALQRRSSDGRLQIFIDGILRRDVDGPNGALDYPNGAQPVNWCGSNQSQTCVNDPYMVLAAEKHDVGSEAPSFHGWLDELRLSNTLRWTTTFSPQTTAYDVDAQTAALYHFNEGAGDVINDAVGLSSGIRKLGGSPAGPQWSTDTPITGGSPPPPPPPPPPPSETWKVRLSTNTYRVRNVYTRNTDGTRGSQLQIAGSYGVATPVYIDAGTQQTLPICDPNNVATLNGTTYMAVTAPAVSQHGLSILGQQVTGYVSPCDLQ